MDPVPVKVNKVMKRISYKNILSLILIAMMLLTITSCGTAGKEVHESGMVITLPKGFQRATMENATWYYKSSDALAMGIRIYKSDLEKEGLESNSAQDYAAAYIKANSVPGDPEIQIEDKYIYFEYDAKVSGSAYSYLTCIYDHDDTYWLGNFACYKQAYKESRSDFFKWADSVEFENE